MCHIYAEMKRWVRIQKSRYSHFLKHSMHDRCLCIAALELRAGQAKWLEGPFFLAIDFSQIMINPRKGQATELFLLELHSC